MKIEQKKAFTLLEVVIVVAFVSFVLLGMMQLFIHTTALGEITKNKIIALTEAETKMEEIRNHNFSDIEADYAEGGDPGNVFDADLLDGGKGFIYLESSNGELIEIRIVICWRDKYGRVVGEDSNLDGILQNEEDVIDNDRVDSAVELMSLITRR